MIPLFGGTLFAEAGLRTLAFFLQVLPRQEKGEHELSFSEHACAWVVFVRQSQPSCTSDEGHHYQTHDEENDYVHASGFKTSTLHSTNTMALIPRFNDAWPPPCKASRHQHNTLSEKASAVPPAPGPGPMELAHKFRESAVSAFSWPTAEAKEAAASAPHSSAAAQSPILSGRVEERTVGAEALISSPGTLCVRTAKGPSED